MEWLFPLDDPMPSGIALNWGNAIGMAHVAAMNDANQIAVCGVAHSGRLERLTKRHFGPYLESFVWTRERGRVFLDGYVLDQRGEFFHIADLNNHGCIIGTVNWKTGDIRRAVLLEPIRERWGR